MPYLNEQGLTYLKRKLKDFFATLAKQEGAYPRLLAGNLTEDAPPQTEEFLSRPAGGGFPVLDGSRARVRRILGNTVIENQLFAPQTAEVHGVRMERLAQNRLRLSGRVNRSALNLPCAPIDLRAGHFYFFYGDGSALAKVHAVRAAYDPLPPLTAENAFRAVHRVGEHRLVSQITVPIGTEFSGEILSVGLVDLTRRFGAGREPQTVPEVLRRMPEAPAAPEIGRFLNSTARGIASEETLPLPIGEFFPDGMRSVGSVFDEMDDRRAVTRIGVWDLPALLSSLRKENDDPNDTAYRAEPADPAPDPTQPVCADRLTGLTLDADGSLRLSLPGLSRNDLSTARRYLEELDPVIHYVLQSPRIAVFPSPLPVDYAVGAWERVLAEKSAPFRAEIAYARDYTRRVRELDENFVSVETLDELLRALGALYGGTWERRWDATERKWRFTFRE